MNMSEVMRRDSAPYSKRHSLSSSQTWEYLSFGSGFLRRVNSYEPSLLLTAVRHTLPYYALANRVPRVCLTLYSQTFA